MTPCTPCLMTDLLAVAAAVLGLVIGYRLGSWREQLRLLELLKPEL